MAKRTGLTKRLEMEKAERPLDILIRDKEEDNIDRYMELKQVKRKTFVLDPLTIEAIRIFSFESDRGISEMILDMFLKYIPEDVWVRARKKIIKFEETPLDYLEDLPKLDIDSIYYHPYKQNK